MGSQFWAHILLIAVGLEVSALHMILLADSL